MSEHYSSIFLRNNDEIRKMLRYLIGLLKDERDSRGNLFIPGKPPSVPGRKGDMCELLGSYLASDEILRFLYGRMDSLQKAFIQEAVRDSGGNVNFGRFRAKYGGLPALDFNIHGESVVPLICFFTDGREPLPPDLKMKIQNFVPPPPPLICRAIDALPDAEEQTVHETEQAALHDLQAVIQLAAEGGIGVSKSTGRPTEKGAEAVRRVLLCGDFYPEGTEAGDKYDFQMGPAGIRPFAWPLLLQAGKLVKIKGSKLELKKTPAEPVQETLRNLWDDWLGTKIFHEFSRIDVIKGQKSRGRPLFPAAPCREDIADALSELPEGKWVEAEEFFRYLKAAGHDFSIDRNPWSLYIAEQGYGSLGYSHITWDHLSGRFARTFLLEYAAVMGVVDVAVVPPWGAVDDVRDLWGADDFSCLSRYDGLRYIRLTPLGAWMLGGKDEYKPAQTAEGKAVFRILPNLEIVVIDGKLKPSDRLFFERVGNQESERVWKLSREKIVSSCAGGLGIEMIEDFLRSGSGGSLPEAADVFLADIRKGLKKLKRAYPCVMLECDDRATALLLSNDSKLGKLCIFAEDRFVVVREKDKNKFSRLLEKAGFVMPGRGGR